MPIDASIAQSYKPIDGMATLSSLLDTRRKMLELNKSTDTYDSDVAKAKAESSTQQSLATVSAANINPLIEQQIAQTSQTKSKAQVDASSVNSDTNKRTADSQTAQTGSKAAQFKLANEYMSTALQTASGMYADPRIANKNPATYNPSAARRAVMEAEKQMIDRGVPAELARQSTQPFFAAADRPGDVQQMIKNTILSSQSAGQQSSTVSPTVLQNSNGQQTTNTNVNPLAEGGQGAPVTAPVQQQLPPTTTITSLTGQAGYVGPAGPQQRTGNAYVDHGGTTQISQAEGDVNALKRQLSARNLTDGQREIIGAELVKAEKAYQQESGKPTPGFVASGMLPGQGESIAGSQKGINDHYRGLQDRAQNAAQDIGVLQNIISHAKGASTGIGSDKSAIAQAILGKLGIDSAKASTLDYDLLGKNAAMIQLAGGDTNLAKTLAGAANPNSHMSEEAIRQAAHQIIGQKRMDIEGLKMFTPLKKLSDGGHMEAYSSMMPKYMESADPRIMQLPHVSDAEKSKMKASMSPSEQKAFGAKIRALESMGIKP